MVRNDTECQKENVYKHLGAETAQYGMEIIFNPSRFLAGLDVCMIDSDHCKKHQSHHGIRQNTDIQTTDPLLTPPPPALNQREKDNLKKPKTINGTASSSQINLAHLKFPRWRTSCRFSTLLYVKSSTE